MDRYLVPNLARAALGRGRMLAMGAAPGPSDPSALTPAADGGTFCLAFQRAVELVGKRWNGAILAVLMDGPRRFSEILAVVPGLSERLLAERLRELEANRIVLRRVLHGPPVGVEYELTQAGRELEPAVRALTAWARRWMAEEPGRPSARSP